MRPDPREYVFLLIEQPDPLEHWTVFVNGTKAIDQPTETEALRWCDAFDKNPDERFLLEGEL